jgi:serine/threonine-protein kinase
MSKLENLNQQDFIEAKKLFNQAIKLTEPELIDELLARECQDNDVLIAAVKALIAMHNDSEGATITPKQPLSSLINHNFTLQKGQPIGKFIIDKLIGSGGMGDVYLAKREDQEVHQKVAVKVLKNKLNQPALERFQIEKRVLAHLEHPGIARLIDAGVTDGYTYYVMEYIQGLAIDDFCKQQQLTIKQRLRLFIKVCEVVSYAHANLIIHRDLKPKNILITEKGQVKLVDFGIAKPLSQLPGIDELPQTMEGRYALTPQYAAPEQFTDGVVGTACDIYALGLLLFELLTNRKAQDLNGLSLAEIEQKITHKIFNNASKQITQYDVDVSQFKLKKSIQLKKLLKGDLDSIINNAIKKEPEKRYKSVADFATDIENYLHHQPISVRDNQFGYRLQKYLKRNWLAVSALLTLISILSFSTYYVMQERDKAIQEKLLAQQVSDFLVTTFKDADPTKTLGEKITAKEILEQGVRQINKQQNSQVKDKLLMAMGEVYYELAEYNKAFDLLDQVEENNFDKSVLKTKIFSFQGAYDKALDELSQSSYQGSEEKELIFLQVKSEVMNASENPEQAQLIAEQMRYKAQQKFGDGSISYAHYLMDYTAIFHDKVFYADVNIEQYKKIIEIYNNNGLKIDPKLARVYQSISSIYRRKEQFDQALSSLNKAEDIYRRIYGDQHLIIASILNTKAILNRRLNLYDQSRQDYKSSLAIKKIYYGETFWRLSQVFFNIGLTYLAEGRDYEASIENINKAITLMEAKREEKKSIYNHLHRYLSVALINTQKFKQAEEILNELIPYYIEMNYKAGRNLAESRILLAIVYERRGRYNDSLRLFKISIDTLRKNTKPSEIIRLEAEKLFNTLKTMNMLDKTDISG